VGGQIAQGDLGTVRGEGHMLAGWRVLLKWIGESEFAVCDKLQEDVGGEDFGDGAETDEGSGVGCMAAAGEGLSVALDQDFMIAHDDENHTGYA